jgi:hypothetical protein
MASPAMRSGAKPFSNPAGEQPEASSSPAAPSIRRPICPSGREGGIGRTLGKHVIGRRVASQCHGNEKVTPALAKGFICPASLVVARSRHPA